VPFCRHRCGYCDFPLITGRDDLIDEYLRAMTLELQSLGAPGEFDTLFFGGGTPTHLPPEQLRQLLSVARLWLPLAEGYEFSVEANPRDLDEARIDVLLEAGVNRLSLGVQSFGNAQLAVLERDHRAEQIAPLLERLRRAGLDNTSIDLIFGVPGQSLEDWEQSVQQACACEIRHVSAYGLTYEKGTSFWRRREQGGLRPIDEERERQMYALVMNRLPAAGFAQYEISSYAAAGFECRHNLVYWCGESYFAFGPGAARYVDGVRSSNHRSVTTWLRRVLAGESVVAQSEVLDDEDRARELIMLGLRRTAGIDVAKFRQRTGFELHALCGAALEQFVGDGLLEEIDGRLRLTREGRFLADTVTAAFL
jgi:oxygen-independent coproporphyrinogen III oxidase